MATYETYDDAQKAVDALAKANFAVKELSIVGNDLKSVERVTGKLNYGRVSVGGAVSGAWLGLFFGLLLLIFSPTPDYGIVIAALLIGAGIGMLFGIISYLINRRRRDFTSVMQVIADNYQIIVSPESASGARTAMDRIGMRASGVSHTSAPPHSAAPHSAAPHADRDSGAAAPVGEDGADDESGHEQPKEPASGQPSSEPLPPPEYGERI